MREFLIWSIEHDAWWGPGSMGYTRDVKLAGAYERAEAERIVVHANLAGRLHEAMIPVECVERGLSTELPALREYLDTLTINGANIGDIRRALFVPWDSKWNAHVRDETALRERSTESE